MLSVLRRYCAVLGTAVAVLCLHGAAFAQVVVPDAPDEITLPVDVEGWITAAIASLGILVATVLGGFFAFKLIKLVLRWVGMIGS